MELLLFGRPFSILSHFLAAFAKNRPHVKQKASPFSGLTRSFVAGCTRLELATSDVTVGQGDENRRRLTIGNACLTW